MTHRTVAILGAVAMVIALVGSALAHSWYDPWCCSDADCAPIDESRVEALPGDAYLIDGKFHVSGDKVRNSQDGLYHACFPQPDNLRCFYRPPPSI